MSPAEIPVAVFIEKAHQDIAHGITIGQMIVKITEHELKSKEL